MRQSLPLGRLLLGRRSWLLTVPARTVELAVDPTACEVHLDVGIRALSQDDAARNMGALQVYATCSAVQHLELGNQLSRPAILLVKR